MYKKTANGNGYLLSKHMACEKAPHCGFVCSILHNSGLLVHNLGSE